MSIIFASLFFVSTILYVKERHKRLLDALNMKHLQEKQAEDTLLKAEYEELKRRYANLDNLLTASNTRLQNEIDKQKMVSEFQKNLEAMSAKIVQQNREVTMAESKQTLSALITPLQQNINEFKARIETVHTEDTKGRTGLKVSIEEQIKSVIEATKSIGNQANNLATALKGDKKMQGNWGERVLGDILQNSGLQEGISYQSQSKLFGEEGNTQRPDFVLKLSNDNSVILDAKVSLNNYEKYTNCDVNEEKIEYFLSFVQDIKNHIDNLSSKKYHDVSSDMQSIKILGSVMLFIPLESTYYETLRYENGVLHDYAWKKGIVIVGPYNLMPILKVLDSLSKMEQQNKNSQEIAKLGTQMYEKFCLLLDGVEKFKKNINKLGEDFDDDVIKKLTGKGNLVTKAEDMKKLGLKPAKQIPSLFEVE